MRGGVERLGREEKDLYTGVIVNLGTRLGVQKNGRLPPCTSILRDANPERKGSRLSELLKAATHCLRNRQ